MQQSRKSLQTQKFVEVVKELVLLMLYSILDAMEFIQDKKDLHVLKAY